MSSNDHDDAGAERRAGRARALEGQRHVELVGRDERAGRAAEQDRPQRSPVGTPPASVEQLAQRDAERHLVHARAARRCRDRQNSSRAGRVARCRSARTPAPPSRTMPGTLTSVSTLLTTVGLPNRPDLDRERRLVARLAAVALDRVEERRLLAADVRAGAAAHLDVEADAAGRGCRRRGSRAARASVDRVGEPLAAPAGTRRGCRGSRARSRWRSPAIVIASTMANGSSSISTRSLNVPGSDSSALQTR